MKAYDNELIGRAVLWAQNEEYDWARFYNIGIRPDLNECGVDGLAQLVERFLKEIDKD